MSSFTAPLVTEWLDDGTFRVVNGFRYSIGDKDSGLHVDVPDGFVTDLTSVPRAIQWLIRKDGGEAACATVHDVAYRTGTFTAELPGAAPVSIKITQAMADSAFRESMRIKPRVSAVRREALYWAVVAFGVIAWRRWRRHHADREWAQAEPASEDDRRDAHR